MLRMTRFALLGAGLAILAGPAVAQEKAVVQPGQPVQITVTTAAPAPDVSISLGKRTGEVTPCKVRCTHTGGGNIDVQQPSPDTIVVTMTGVAVAYGSPAGAASSALDFTLTQMFDVSFDKPSVKAAKLSAEVRLIGFLRSHNLGTAAQSGTVTVTGGGVSTLTVDVPSHSVSDGKSLSVNDKEGPVEVVLPTAGKFCLNETFKVSASMPKTLLARKAPSAEFAPDPALDPLWISAKEPFKGAAKKDLGFQVTIKVVPQDLPAGKK